MTDMKKPNISYSLYCAIVVSLGGFVFGFDASVISGVIGFVSTEFNLTPIQAGFVVAAPTLSGLAGTMIIGPLSDYLGRKKVLLCIAFLYLVSALASAFATSYVMLVVARALGGLAFTSLMIAPMYIGEISPTASRGKRVSINQLNIVLGLSAAYFTNYFILDLSTSGAAWVSAIGLEQHTWRWMLGLEIIPATVFFLALFTITDTPRWLSFNGKHEQAQKVVKRLFEPAEAEQELQKMRQNTQSEPASLWTRLGDMFGPKMRLALIIGLIVGITQQVTGINAIFFYAPTIFEQSGIGTNAAFLQAVLVGVINVIFTFVAMALIDRWGRKPLLILGLSGIIVSMALCTYGFSKATYTITSNSLSKIESVEDIEQSFEPAQLSMLVNKTFDNDVEFKQALQQAIGKEAARDHESLLISSSIEMNAMLILVGILGFVASFAISLGPVMWVLFSEIFPNQLRGVAISFVGLVNSLMSFSVQLVFPLELAALGAAMTFAIYGIFAAIGLALVLWLLPETKGKSLEELEGIFGRKA
jgi:sugar porter (SP) family MFS transporter